MKVQSLYWVPKTLHRCLRCLLAITWFLWPNQYHENLLSPRTLSSNAAFLRVELCGVGILERHLLSCSKTPCEPRHPKRPFENVHGGGGRGLLLSPVVPCFCSMDLNPHQASASLPHSLGLLPRGCSPGLKLMASLGLVFLFIDSPVCAVS